MIGYLGELEFVMRSDGCHPERLREGSSLIGGRRKMFRFAQHDNSGCAKVIDCK
jgi:hypothetical protein